MNKTTGLDFKLQEMAGRIRELREISAFSTTDMAKFTGVSVEEYEDCEAGRNNLTFAFIYRCAQALNVDVTDIISGASPKLSSYTVTRSGAGQRIERAHGLLYYNLAPFFKNRIAEPLFVTAAFSEEALHRDIELTSHAGQECDIVQQGRLKVQVGEHYEVLNPGDAIYYDSSTPHGMIAVDGEDCQFYAIVLNPTGEIVPELADMPVIEPEKMKAAPQPKSILTHHVYERFVIPQEAADGSLLSIHFQHTENFNFAFDVVDEMARLTPDKLAMLHVDKEFKERRFTFEDISRQSSRAANYFKSLGIKKGDRVMLVLKRHWQFWVAMMGLNKLGAIAIPASNQLVQHDFEYRFQAAGVKAIVATCDDGVPEQVDMAVAACPSLELRILVNAQRPGWHDFNAEYPLFRSTFPRPEGEEAAGGDDLMLMFFTSGTTGYPKIAAHSYKYALGHFVTAKYWHCVDPQGLHLTISDTGWAKAMWGKLYGQWLAEGAVFVYDFDRFNANDILPMFAKYHITTFCAPPTMYRFLIKEDLSRFDLSSIKHATIAGEALNPEVFYQFQKATGVTLMEGFGQSETTVVIANLFGMTPQPGSMGKPIPLYHVELLDSEGQPVKTGQTGEICIDVSDGGPCGLFRYYYNDEIHTKEAWHDGWYHTGDTAWQDENGYYWYVGRVDDLIKSSGYRIGPFEIESVIMELPYVLECGVSAAPDETRGQVVKASIVLTKGTEGTEELKKEIQNYVKKHTAPYKYPRIVVFKDELPKTVSGKIMRNKL